MQLRMDPTKAGTPGAVPKPFLPLPEMGSAEKERFTSKYRVDESGCWLWAGSLGRGYGQFAINKRMYLAHRLAYTLHKGPIPAGLTIDHLCRVRSCVNPDHLEAVTNRENILRGIGTSAINARKTHCIRGHEFTEENTYLHPRSRRSDRTCRKCRRTYTRNYRRRERAALRRV